MLRGLYLTIGDRVDAATNRAVQAAAARMLERPPAGVTDVVPAYANVYLEFDDAQLGAERVARWARACAEVEGAEPASRLIEIPVDYRGPDLPAVAAHAGLSEAEAIARHAGREYRVFALGFTPGFPYLGTVDPALRMPRRPTPRPRVDAHSVAIANEQTGVYPSASPGGWHLLGTALVAVYDLHRADPFLLHPGDRVRFVPTASGDPPPDPEPLALLPPEPRHPLLEVLEPGLCDLVVDRGRRMMGRFGLARGGPLDAWSAAQANHLLGNPPHAPTVELNLRGPVLEARAPGVIGFAGWGLRPVLNGRPLACFARIALARGDTVRFQPLPYGTRAYLALLGGVDSGSFAGSASVDLRAGIGRPLAAGDILGAAASAGGVPARAVAGATIASLGPDPTTVRIVPGPQADDDALAALQQRPFVVRGGDRMGVRLAGAPLPGHEIVSEAVPLGAIQIAPDGQPVILLNDRGTLGGYAKPALVDPRDLPRVGQLVPGQRVAFRIADLAGARPG